MLGNTSKITHHAHPTMPTDHVHQCHISMGLEHLQGRSSIPYKVTTALFLLTDPIQPMPTNPGVSSLTQLTSSLYPGTAAMGPPCPVELRSCMGLERPQMPLWGMPFGHSWLPAQGKHPRLERGSLGAR